MSERFAVYFAPPHDSALAELGRRWLGRDVRRAVALGPAAVDGLPAERLWTITASPRRYGLHATLKPPFALAAGRTTGELHAALAAFAERTAPVELPPLELAAIGGFLALVPTRPSAALEGFAAAIVRAFDAFRAPPAAAELARRAHAGLDARERELLAAWGYPYVLDRWRFHMTLTERLDDGERERVRRLLEPLAAPLAACVRQVDDLALFVEPAPGEPLVERARFALTGTPLGVHGAPAR